MDQIPTCRCTCHQESKQGKVGESGNIPIRTTCPSSQANEGTVDCFVVNTIDATQDWCHQSKYILFEVEAQIGPRLRSSLCQEADRDDLLWYTLAVVALNESIFFLGASVCDRSTVLTT